MSPILISTEHMKSESLFIKKVEGLLEVVILTVYLNLPQFVDVAVMGASGAC